VRRREKVEEYIKELYETDGAEIFGSGKTKKQLAPRLKILSKNLHPR
jgi:hypothetical protein